jgi:hypothetical protein
MIKPCFVLEVFPPIYTWYDSDHHIKRGTDRQRFAY